MTLCRTRKRSRDDSRSRLAEEAPFKQIFLYSTHSTVPRAGTVVAAIDRAVADLRRVDRSTSLVQVPVRCRPALLGQACARAAQATQPLSPAAQLLSVDRCTLASTAFDVAAAMLETSSTLWAPRPDLLYRSGRGAFQRLRACLAEGGRAFRCDGVCGRYAARSRARSELDTMFSIPNHVMLHEPS